jgi:hypothetical protein
MRPPRSTALRSVRVAAESSPVRPSRPRHRQGGSGVGIRGGGARSRVVTQARCSHDLAAPPGRGHGGRRPAARCGGRRPDVGTWAKLRRSAAWLRPRGGTRSFSRRNPRSSGPAPNATYHIPAGSDRPHRRRAAEQLAGRVHRPPVPGRDRGGRRRDHDGSHGARVRPSLARGRRPQHRGDRGVPDFVAEDLLTTRWAPTFFPQSSRSERFEHGMNAGEPCAAEASHVHGSNRFK